MTATETLHSELPADLVERVLNLPAAQLEALREIVERERELEAEYQRKAWTEIRRRVEAYDRGEEKAHEWRDVVARIEAKLRAAHPEAPQ